MKRFFYFQLTTTDSLLLPVDNWLGGEVHSDTASLNLQFKDLDGAADESLVDLVITAGTGKTVLNALVQLANYGTDPFIVVADVQASEFAHPNITGIAASTE